RQNLELLVAEGTAFFENAQFGKCQYAMLEALYLDPRNEIAQYYYRKATEQVAAEKQVAKIAGTYGRLQFGAPDGHGFELVPHEGEWRLRFFTPENPNVEVLNAQVTGWEVTFSRKADLGFFQ